jgi:hypothetical protein
MEFCQDVTARLKKFKNHGNYSSLSAPRSISALKSLTILLPDSPILLNGCETVAIWAAL